MLRESRLRVKEAMSDLSEKIHMRENNRVTCRVRGGRKITRTRIRVREREKERERERPNKRE